MSVPLREPLRSRPYPFQSGDMRIGNGLYLQMVDSKGKRLCELLWWQNMKEKVDLLLEQVSCTKTSTSYVDLSEGSWVRDILRVLSKGTTCNDPNRVYVG